MKFVVEFPEQKDPLDLGKVVGKALSKIATELGQPFSADVFTQLSPGHCRATLHVESKLVDKSRLFEAVKRADPIASLHLSTLGKVTLWPIFVDQVLGLGSQCVHGADPENCLECFGG